MPCAKENLLSLIELAKIYDFLADNQITRTDLIIALGGGVCGDMVGYAASSYLRGVDFVNIPTTLLSMVDSSVGGKTAVNIPAGKNQVGSFYQPKLVICDTNTLKSLSEELIADGVGEIAKYAVLEDKGLFDLLLSGEFFENIEDIIETCVKIKDEYVSADVCNNQICSCNLVVCQKIINFCKFYQIFAAFAIGKNISANLIGEAFKAIHNRLQIKLLHHIISYDSNFIITFNFIYKLSNIAQQSLLNKYII